MKNLLAALFVVTILAIGFLIVKNTKTPNIQPPVEEISPPPTTVNPTQKDKVTVGPEEQETIKIFFKKINDARGDEAVLMMTPEIVQDDATKQAWAVQFNAFKKVSITKIEESLPERWTNTIHTYKVTLNVEMKPEAQNAVIPFYGYDKGQNVRFVSIIKVEGAWKIQDVATGP